MDDRAIVASQLGRSPRAFRRVVVRCPYGLPAVTEQEPYDDAAVSRLEAAGGVERWSTLAAEDAALASSLEVATEEQRRVRRKLAGSKRGRDNGAALDLGIAGSHSLRHLKCLHAHVAFALARPGYTLGDRILDEIESSWPAAECCSEQLRGPN